MPTRRRFLELSAAAAGAFGLSPLIKIPLIGEQPDTYDVTRKRDVGRARVPLNILILGGTGFTGPEQVEYAIARGHRVTLFNRGKTRPGVFKGKVAEELIGDLNSDTSALKGKKFDVVIDNPTTLPFWVQERREVSQGQHEALHLHLDDVGLPRSERDRHQREQSDGADARRASIRISPINATAPAIRVVESRELRRVQGARRAGSAMQYPGINTVIRPCLIVGPLDRTDRFTYWPARIDKGGEVLAPDKPEDPNQFIDSRDLAEWTIRMAEARELGTYNAIGPAEAVDDRRDVERRQDGDQLRVRQFTWVPWEFLKAQGVRPWRHMTVWQPPRARRRDISAEARPRRSPRG